MRYLNCIEMLNYVLKILRSDSRQPVPVSKMPELAACLRGLQAIILEEQINDAVVSVTMTDLIRSTLSVQTTELKMVNLSEAMKQGLIDGVMKVRNAIACQAFDYYDEHEFEPTPEVIPLMRTVVEGYAASGGKI